MNVLKLRYQRCTLSCANLEQIIHIKTLKLAILLSSLRDTRQNDFNPSMFAIMVAKKKKKEIYIERACCQKQMDVGSCKLFVVCRLFSHVLGKAVPVALVSIARTPTQNDTGGICQTAMECSNRAPR